MARKKKVVITEEINRTRAAEIFGEYAEYHNAVNAIIVEMDEEVRAIRERYQHKLAALKEKKEECFNLLEHFGRTNKKLFEKRKTMNFSFGKLGFRTGMPQLKTMPGFTWKKVLKACQTVFPDFIKQKPALDKEAIITRRKEEKIIAIMPLMGVRVVQDDTFFVEPKSEEA